MNNTQEKNKNIFNQLDNIFFNAKINYNNSMMENIYVDRFVCALRKKREKKIKN